MMKTRREHSDDTKENKWKSKSTVSAIRSHLKWLRGSRVSSVDHSIEETTNYCVWRPMQTEPNDSILSIINCLICNNVAYLHTKHMSIIALLWPHVVTPPPTPAKIHKCGSMQLNLQLQRSKFLVFKIFNSFFGHSMWLTNANRSSRAM